MFDFHLLKMKESGVVDKLMTRYKPDPPQTIGTPEAVRLGYDNLIFPALVLSFGTCGALAVVLVERLVQWAGEGNSSSSTSWTGSPKNRRPNIIAPNINEALVSP